MIRLLDLFCGAGGAALGYHRAFEAAGVEHEIVGVDIKPMPRYPFTFVQADAMTYPLEGFDAIHASPPCQAYSIMRNLPWLRDKEYPRLIAGTLERLEASGVPYIIENVYGARHDLPAGWLCGGMFGLPFYRHRLFATNFAWFAPGHPRHQWTIRNGRALGSRARDIVHNGAQRVGANVGHAAGVRDARDAMGIDWMSRDELHAGHPACIHGIHRAAVIGRTQASRFRACPGSGIATRARFGWTPLPGAGSGEGKRRTRHE